MFAPVADKKMTGHACFFAGGGMLLHTNAMKSENS
jgi:hypothetical protein